MLDGRATAGFRIVRDKSARVIVLLLNNARAGCRIPLIRPPKFRESSVLNPIRYSLNASKIRLELYI